MNKWIKIGMAVAAIVVGDGGAILYNQYLSPKLTDESVFVAKAPISANSRIQAADLKQVLIPRNIVQPGSITNLMDAVNKLAAANIQTNQPITDALLETDALQPQKGQEIVALNSKWIAALPDTLRRGDHVTIYLYHQNGNTPISNTKAVQSVTKTTAAYLQNIPVEFVHNGSNQEITNQSTQHQPTTGTLTSRSNGSGDPAEVELLMSPQKYADLVSHVESGSQLVLAYSVTGEGQ